MSTQRDSCCWLQRTATTLCGSSGLSRAALSCSEQPAESEVAAHTTQPCQQGGDSSAIGNIIYMMCRHLEIEPLRGVLRFVVESWVITSNESLAYLRAALPVWCLGLYIPCVLFMLYMVGSVGGGLAVTYMCSERLLTHTA